MTDVRADHIVSAAELARTDLRGTVLLDVRVGPDGPDQAAYESGHIPGARFVDIDADLAGPVTPHSGARPLPTRRGLAESLRRWDIGSSTPVVVYDDSTSAAAARAWWVLRWAGVKRVRLLDGGLRAWRSTSRAVVIGPDSDAADAVVHRANLRTGALPVVDTDEVAALTERGVLLDARPATGFHGVDGTAGHIPGAVSAPVFDDFDADGRLRPAHELAGRYRALGVGAGTPIVASYCSSGVAAALQVLVLATIGVEAALYPGSLSQWISDPHRRTVAATIDPCTLVPAELS